MSRMVGQSGFEPTAQYTCNIVDLTPCVTVIELGDNLQATAGY